MVLASEAVNGKGERYARLFLTAADRSAVVTKNHSFNFMEKTYVSCGGSVDCGREDCVYHVGIRTLNAGEMHSSETMRKKRHEMYEWLISFGVPEMGEQEKNRIKTYNFLTHYSDARCVNLRREIAKLNQTHAQKNQARREKHARKMEEQKKKNDIL